MKSLYSFKKDKRAVFGLTSVQAFFAIILGLALLAYVIIVIMGVLSTNNLIPTSTLSTFVRNESSFINGTTDTLATVGIAGFANPVAVVAVNASAPAQVIAAGNYTLSSAGVIINATAINWNAVSLSYTYNYNSDIANGANSILANTSQGITGFFSAINPVYAILAILVIILVLVVLVRVVTGGQGGQRSEPQL